MYSVFFTDSNNGWAVGRSGTILKTTNGGNEWLNLTTVNFHHFYSVHFINNSIGWIAGNRIIKTTDGGETWFIQYPTGDIESIHFVDENHGWAVGDGGTILKTTNGGENWVEEPDVSKERYYSVNFTDKNTGWVVGRNETILKTTTGGATYIKEEEIDEIPTNYNLSQNYPNPFNPSTKIRYSVPQSSNVVIKVFDILGNEIETLIDEQKSVGTYEITWYANNLPSGVYFYQLQAGSPSAGSGQSFVETKKMILLR